ncbi:AraC family transcriptional regulator [Kaistella sp. DKR-2]|uniref:helix-turn-helix domain-containing protein n=1 Tax=Kaistella soli TaxID=2849654 RepID=UPI001C27263B|nr:AraC family transcriptional regulator [Kaistella soli]MBU8882301.1 AraC family transcriptional regulator [Kaistella soli]
MQMLRLLILPFLFFAELLVAQKGSHEPYERIIRTYAHIQINDSAALPQIRVLIALAKKEKNAAQLTKAYHDALHYTPSEDLKLRYADSAITAAHFSCKDDLIATAYLGKGIVFYFNYKRYRPALLEYLKAMRYAEKTEDHYLIHKIGYHLGLVKSYLGDHCDAIRHFEYGAAYFLSEMKKNPHPNILHNMRKGYYNSIRQMVICHQHLNNDKKADSLISIGENGIPLHPDFKLVRSYFHQFRGTSEFRKGNYRHSIEELDIALPEIERNRDFAWASVIYFYQGKNRLQLGQHQKAIGLFKKVDSVYRRQQFLFPELCENYRLLMHDAQHRNHMNDALYYSDVHRKLENQISADVIYLSSVLHAEGFKYEKGRLTQSKRIMTIGLILSLMLMAIFFYQYYLEKETEKRFRIMIAPSAFSGETPSASTKRRKGKFTLPQEIYDRIKEKMQDFEDGEQYLDADLTEKTLADRLRTNTQYLSAFINISKGVNFRTYLNELRIRYIAKQLSENPEYLKYNNEGLASKCGMGSRSTFSRHFFKIYGMPPQEYVKKCIRADREQERDI